MIWQFLRRFFRRTVTYALVGGSGTGKSHLSKFVAAKYNIDCIIDDGLLIKNERIVAGRSAKEEQTIIAAVKAAVFSNKQRRDEVARRLLPGHFRKILILGTSEKMVTKIALRLQLPLPGKIIKIGDFARQEDIDRALRTRKVEGKHIIPLPAVEVRKSYPDIFLASQPVFRGKVSKTIGIIPESHEKSLVRPAYSAKPAILISDAALRLMVKNAVREHNPSVILVSTGILYGEWGYCLDMTIDIPWGTRLEKNIDELKRYITENIERFTGILIEGVNVTIDKVVERE